MPHLDGLETTRLLRSEGDALFQPRIIALTANAMQGDRERCLEAGCDDYLAKPVTRESLQDALDVPVQPSRKNPTPSPHASSDPATGSSLIQLVYASSATHRFAPDELSQILTTSRRNNEKAGITGVLLYADGNVMQALEGPADAVDPTLRRVQDDPRHHSISVLHRNAADERAFPDWAMGVRSLQDLPENERKDVRPLFDLTETGPTRAQRLLAPFRALSV